MGCSSSLLGLWNQFCFRSLGFENVEKIHQFSLWNIFAGHGHDIFCGSIYAGLCDDRGRASAIKVPGIAKQPFPPKSGSCGTVVRNVELKVIDPKTGCSLGHNQTREILPL